VNRRPLGSFRLWLAPGMGVKRHVSLASLGLVLLVTGVIGAILWGFAGDRQVISDPIEEVLVSDAWETWGIWVSLAVAIAGLWTAVAAVRRLNRSLLSHWLDRPSDVAEVLHRELILSKGPHVVALGGGTGLSMLLRGLRAHSSNLTAVVSVADDGGSSGRLREAFDMPAPGDLSDCLAALSEADQELGRLLEYRFERGAELQGHTFGNLLITTLTEVEGDFGRALEALNSLLQLRGRVFPAATQPVSLVANKAHGVEVRGESALREVPGVVTGIRIEPSDIGTPPGVINAIANADVIVLGPGSLFSSTIPPLLVDGVRSALLASPAPVVYFCNIMTEAGETDGMTAFDHVQALHDHLGAWPDVVLVNSQPLDPGRLEAYGAEGAEQVAFDAAPFDAAGVKYVLTDLLVDGAQAYHDSAVLAAWLTRYTGHRRSERWAERTL